MDLEKILSGLNEEQQSAVVAPFCPVVVIAGAGAGKTTVLTRRAAYCIAKGIEPEHIVAITFTNKAAREMKDRLNKLLGVGVAEHMHIQTFHSFCYRILRANAGAIGTGYDQKFSILDEDDHKAVIKDVTKKLNIDTGRFNLDSFVRWISEQKDFCVRPEDVESNFLIKMKLDVYKEYEKVLAHTNSMDFDDLLCKTYWLLKNNPDILEKYQRNIHALLIDEAQDTNDAQYRLSKLLGGGRKNIFVVGDSDQAIYGFRHANIKNFLGFRDDYPNAVVIKLEQNYRSTGTILDATNQMIANNMNRYEKDLWTENHVVIPIRRRQCENDVEEGRWVASNIESLVREEGMKYSDIAVLYRANAVFGAIEAELLRRRIPYHVFAGKAFLDRAEVKDALAYLRLVHNPKDMNALSRIVNVPSRGIGDKTKEKIVAACVGVGFFDGFRNVLPLIGKQAAAGLLDFGEKLLAFVKRDSEGMSVGDNLNLFMKEVGYIDAIEGRTKESEIYKVKLEHLEQLFDLANTYDEEPTLEGFLEHIALSKADDDDVGNKVSLMTCHRAKGLEYPAVFVCGMDDNILPSWKAVDDIDLLEEERRVAYVAMTRAKKYLFLSSAFERKMFGQIKKYAPSQFLKEIPDKLVVKEGRQDYWSW